MESNAPPRCAVNNCRSEATTVIAHSVIRLVLCDRHADGWEYGVAKPWAEAHDASYSREPIERS